MEKLFRLDTKHSTKGTENEKGTGLGLILCKDFIEKNSGRIWVESESGRGSVFFVALPSAVDHTLAVK
jgi:signal transduction histidine kinase